MRSGNGILKVNEGGEGVKPSPTPTCHHVQPGVLIRAHRFGLFGRPRSNFKRRDMSKVKSLIVLMVVYAELCVGVLAQSPTPYGLPVSLENAKKISAAAMAEARKNNWNMVVAIVDPGGTLGQRDVCDQESAVSRPVQASDKSVSGSAHLRQCGIVGACCRRSCAGGRRTTADCGWTYSGGDRRLWGYQRARWAMCTGWD